MKDKEAQQTQEQRFISLSEEIVMQLRKTCHPESGGQYVNIIKTETSGGTRALILTSEGSWDGRVQMMGWQIGTNPDIDRVIEEYASVGDENYHALELSEDWESSKPEREAYIRNYREGLLNRLLTDMESALQRIQS
jgi:hypothetical protein